MKSLFLFALLLFSNFTFAQNKFLNLGIKKTGIALGNAQSYNGLRLNLWDHKTDTINGLNISAFSEMKSINGIAIGLLATSADNINGVAIGGFFAGADSKFNGLGISGLALSADTMNGMFIGGFGITTRTKSTLPKVVRGFSIGMATFCEKFSGLSIGFISKNEYMNGITFSILSNETESSTKGAQIGLGNFSYKLSGIQIGAFNRSNYLYGIQFGLWNVAYNKKYLKKLPFINVNFRKEREV